MMVARPRLTTCPSANSMYMGTIALTAAAKTSSAQTAVASLPYIDPTGGGEFSMTTAEAKALDLLVPSAAIDGWAGFSSRPDTFAFGVSSNSSNAVVPEGEYDLFGVVAHEFSEILGRQMNFGVNYDEGPGDGSGYYPYDLFDFSAPRTRSFDSSAANRYFSIDNGVTNLDNFNTDPTGDLFDWGSGAGADSYLAFSTPGVANLVTPTDLLVLNVLGYQPTPAVTSAGPVEDFTGDGLSDILWQNTNGDAGVWLTSAGGGYTAVDFGAVSPSWSIQAVGDFNGDGKADILWRNTDGEVGEWLSNSGSGYSGFTSVDLAAPSTSWMIEGVGDFNGDGLSDILWRNTNGDTGIWLTNANGSYSSIDFGTVDPSWSIQAVGDFNGDGKADILWRNTDGEVGEWLSNAGSGYTGFTSVYLGVVPASWTIEGVGDFNGDGLTDILWRNTNGDTGVWLSNATGSYSSIDFGVVDASWRIQAVGDYNGDGKADILWRNTNGDVEEWRSKSGSGYTGFTSVDLGVVSPSWNVVGDEPPALAVANAPNAGAFAHAMASMAAKTAGGETIASTMPPHPTTPPMLAIAEHR